MAAGKGGGPVPQEQKPSPGRIVRYVDRRLDEHTREPAEWPATIVRVYQAPDGEVVSLTVLCEIDIDAPFGTKPVTDVPYSAEPKAHSWHWPPR